MAEEFFYLRRDVRPRAASRVSRGYVHTHSSRERATVRRSPFYFENQTKLGGSSSLSFRKVCCKTREKMKI